MRRDRGLPFRHAYFRLGETASTSAYPCGLAVVMIRTPYTLVIARHPEPKNICLMFLHLYIVFYSFVTVLWPTGSNILYLWNLNRNFLFVVCLMNSFSGIVIKTTYRDKGDRRHLQMAIRKAFFATRKSLSSSSRCQRLAMRLSQSCKERL